MEKLFAPQSQQKHILITEDEDELRSYLEFALKREGYRVSLAKNIKEAVQIIAGAKPDLLVLDITLPDGNGLALCKRLKGLPFTRSLPVLILSARADTGAYAESIAAHADHYLNKPIEKSEQLLGWIRALLGKPALSEEENRCEIKSWFVDRNKGIHTLYYNKKAVFSDLPALHLDLIFHLMKAYPESIERIKLCHLVWGKNFTFNDHELTVLVSRLRKKFNAEGLPFPVKSCRYIGYEFDPSPMQSIGETNADGEKSPTPNETNLPPAIEDFIRRFLNSQENPK
ncbi:MAG: response regulator transcription factor [Elusimicrobia bacterium]|nr:response regulator transcription factor [Elusimicrobiota bacterium]